MNFGQYEAFVKAVEAGTMTQAAEVIADGEPLEADVTKAYDGLLNAAEGLVRASDRSSLNDLIEKAEAVAAEIAEGKYLPDGQEAFQAALDAAKALTKDDAQATIDAAAQTLTEAMAALRKKADKTELEALLNELEALDASDYTAASYAAVAASIANLKTLLADETLDAEEGQAVVDNAVAQARAAKAKADNMDEYERTLKELRELNDRIPGEQMSAKISRLEDLTAKIFKLAKEQPQKLSGMRKFMDYYLPTSLKLLTRYEKLDAQGVEGTNISDAKRQIEDTMDTMITAFEKQLDKLFLSESIDISADIATMQNLMRADGLMENEIFGKLQ